MKLTKNWLTTNANTTSFARGKSYESSVRKLKKDGDTYTAKVDGSETYKVEIKELKDSISTNCTCPYNYDGICKHIVAVGLSILSGNFKEVKTTVIMEESVLSLQNEEPIDAASFYKNEFKKAKKDKQEVFLKRLFAQDTAICRQFLTYIRPPAPPLSISTDIDVLSNDIATRVMEIDTDDYLTDEDERDDYGRGRGRYDYDDYDEDYEEYDIGGLEKEVLRVIDPFGKKATQTLEAGSFLDAVRMLLGIYEAQFLVEAPELGDYNDFSYTDAINVFFTATATIWTEKAVKKGFKTSDYKVALQLILQRWQHFKRFQGKEEIAPYEFLNEELFITIIQKAEAEHDFLDFMTEHKLHTAMHFELTKTLCIALGKNDFLLEQLTKYGLDNAGLAKSLMQQYIDRNDRDKFVGIAQKACELFNWAIKEFVAEQILPTDNLGFFKNIVSEVATSRQRLDLFYRWREQVTPMEQESYIERHKSSNALFYIALLTDAKRFSDVLIFAEQNVENLNTNIFSTAAELVINVYPNEIFPLYCERVSLYMNRNGSGRPQYQTAVSMLKPVRKIKGKEEDIKVFAAELRKMYTRLPAFLDELKKGGF